MEMVQLIAFLLTVLPVIGIVAFCLLFLLFRGFFQKKLTAEDIAKALNVPADHVKLTGKRRFEASLHGALLMGYFERYNKLGSRDARYRLHLTYKTHRPKNWVSVSGKIHARSDPSPRPWKMQVGEFDAMVNPHGAPRALMGAAQYDSLTNNFYGANIRTGLDTISFAWEGFASAKLVSSQLPLIHNVHVWSQEYLQASPRSLEDASLSVFPFVEDPSVQGKMLTRLVRQNPSAPEIRRQAIEVFAHGMPEVVVSCVHHAEPQLLQWMDAMPWTPERRMQVVGTWFARSGPQDPLSDAIHARFVDAFPLDALRSSEAPGAKRAFVPILAHHWHRPELQRTVLARARQVVGDMTTQDVLLWVQFLAPRVPPQELLPFGHAVAHRSMSQAQARALLAVFAPVLEPRPELFSDPAWVGLILNLIEYVDNDQAFWIGQALAAHAPAGCVGAVHEAHKSLGWTHPARDDLKAAANAMRERVGAVGGLSVAAEPQQAGGLSQVQVEHGALSPADSKSRG